MSLDNFRNRTIIWDTVNKDFPQPIQTMRGDVNARTLLIKIVDNGTEVDLTGHSLKLTYQYTNSSNSGFVMIPPKDLAKGEFILVIPTEMTATGVIEANLILLNKDKEQVIVSKNLTFISDNSTVSDLAQEVNNKIDDFTKLLLANMPQVMRSELNDLHAQTESNKSNIELKANLADMTSLQSAMTELKKEVEAFGISPENLVTIKSLLDAIASNASEAEVVELINSVKVLTSNISLMSNGDYSPKANQTDLESLQHTVNDHSATISAKANQTDLDNLQANVNRQGIAISTKAEQSDLSITNKNVATAQETANKAESEAKNAMAKATEAQANSLPLNSNAVSASKLATPRKLGVNLQSSSPKDFDGSSDVTDIGVTGVLPIANGGTSTSDGVINTIAYANSADGTDDFTTVYPNLNLIDGTKDFSGLWEWVDNWTTDGTYKGLTVKKKTTQWGGIHKTFTAPKDGTYTFSAYVKSSGSNANIHRVIQKNGIDYWDDRFYKSFGNNFDWLRDSFTVTLKAKDTVSGRYEISGSGTDSILWTAGHKWEQGSTATPWMPSASEVTTADYPKYVGFSNSIKPNKKSSDYNWLPLNGNAVSASKLATPRKLGVNLQSSSFQDFDGSSDATNIGVSGVLPIANGGTATSNGVINTIAYANSADGTDGFTTVYPNLNLLNFKSGLKIGQFLAWINGLTIERNPARAVFDYVSVIPGTTYTINSNWDKTERIAIYAYDSNDGKNATFIYDGSSAKWVSPSVIGRVITQKTTISIPDGMNFIRVVFFAKDTSAKLTLQDILDAKIKLEPGPIATPWMPSASEVTINDYPKYVGFSNSIKPNKKSSDYNWLPMGLVSIDRATGSLKPAVIGIDCAEAHPVGSVITNTSSSSSGYSTGKWENIGSAVIGSTTIYYWKRTA